MTTTVNQDLPVRLVSRLTTELALMSLRELLRLVPGRLETAIIAQALLRGSLPFFCVDNALVLPGTRPLVGSGSAIARSLNRSPETVRRHMHVLERQGMFAVAPEGVLLDPTPAAGRRMLHFLSAIHDGMLWLAGELHGWGVVRAPAHRVRRTISPVTVLRAALDLRLMGFENFRGPIGGWTSLVVWNALSAVSVRHITTNRTLSKRFMSQSTPDRLRRPTTARTLCSVCGLPYATVWRHLAALEREGRIGRDGFGYIMRTEQLLTKEIEARVAIYVQDVLNRVERLFAEGLGPNAIPSLFLGPRPELVPIR